MRSILFLLFAALGSSSFQAVAATGRILDQKSLYSHGKEELIIRDFFQDRRGGVFLDVGFAFPKKNSTTYYLEKHLGGRVSE